MLKSGEAVSEILIYDYNCRLSLVLIKSSSKTKLAALCRAHYLKVDKTKDEVGLRLSAWAGHETLEDLFEHGAICENRTYFSL